MFCLDNLYIKNFLSFSGEHLITFPEKGLVSLKGICNNDNALSNGAGKTSLLEAIAYAFDYCLSPATELQNWNEEEPFKIVLQFKDENSVFKIIRGPGKYELCVNEEVYKASMAKDFLRKTLNIPEIISFITYKPQGVYGNFLSLNNVDKFDFLTKLLNLQVIESIIEFSRDSIKNIENSIIDLTNKTKLLEKENEMLTDQKSHMVLQLKNYLQKIQELEQKLITSTNELSRFLSNKYCGLDEFKQKFLLEKEKAIKLYDFQKKELENKFNESIKINEEKLVFLETEINLLLKDEPLETQEIQKRSNEIIEEKKTIFVSINELKTKKELLEKTFSELPFLQQQFKSLIDKKCITCNQDFVEDITLMEKVKNKIKKIQIEKNTTYVKINDQILQLEKILEEKEQQLHLFNIAFSKSAELYKKQSQYKLCKQSLSELRNNYDYNLKLIEANFLKVKREIEIKIANCEQEYNYSQKIQEEKLQNNINTIKLQLNENKKSVNDLTLQIKNIEDKSKNKEIYCNQTELIKLDSDKKKEQEICNCLGKENFLTLVFEEFLFALGNEANSFLKNIPNASDFFLAFETEKLTQKGVLKRGIVLKVFQKGNERLFKMLSGGEKCAINLAIDVAIGNILSKRSGKSYGWLIYDEPFDSMDLFSKMESLEILKSIAKEKLVVVVEHTNDLNELFDKNITVGKNNGCSFVLNNFCNTIGG